MKPVAVLGMAAIVAAAVGLGVLHLRRKPPVPAAPTIAASTTPRAQVTPAATSPASLAAATSTDLEGQWGIRIMSVALASADFALDLRYQVVDPEKAARLYDGATHAFVLDVDHEKAIAIGEPPQNSAGRSQHSRARSRALMMREAGSFPPPPNRILEGKIYSVLVPNLDRAVTRGTTVAIVIGEFSTDEFTVR